jgi:SAM-dependent methyltransferase
MPDGRTAQVFAIDPLAHIYNAMLEHHGITPPVYTIFGEAERLHIQFHPCMFDLVYARNCLDHCINPAMALRSIVEVLKPTRCAVLEHATREGSRNRFAGLHGWDLWMSETNGLEGMDRQLLHFNASQALLGLAFVESEAMPSGWFRAVIRKYERELSPLLDSIYA